MALNIRIFIFLAVTLLLGSTALSVPGAIAARGLSFLCKNGPCVDAGKKEEMTPFSPLDCEEEAFVLIITPEGEKKVVFDTDEPGTLRIQARALAYPEELSRDIRWEMEPIGTIRPEITPEVGPEVEIVFRGLPERNEGFGSKTITAMVPGACGTMVTLSDEIRVEVFFDPIARNNPGGMMPNWAYYWKQASAGQGIDFTYLPQPVCAPGGTPLGRYDYDADRIELYDALMRYACRARPDGSAAVHIDCFAETLRHEQQHQVELRSWWAGHPTGPPNACGSIARGVMAMIGHFDTDLDIVPTAIELALPGCNPLKKRSCPGRPFDDVLDVEMNAYRVGWGWRIGAADNEDWSAGGKQWRR